MTDEKKSADIKDMLNLMIAGNYEEARAIHHNAVVIKTRDILADIRQKQTSETTTEGLRVMGKIDKKGQMQHFHRDDKRPEAVAHRKETATMVKQARADKKKIPDNKSVDIDKKKGTAVRKYRDDGMDEPCDD